VSECVEPLTDPGLETLSEVFDSAVLTKYLQGVSLGQWDRGTIEETRIVRVLKHHLGQRCTMEIGVRTQNGWQFLIGKVYRDDRPDILRAMKRIQRAGFGPHDEFSIPRPLAYLKSLHFFLQEKVEGPVAKEIFKSGDERCRAAAAKRCALWLARFHEFGPKAGPIFDAERCLGVLRERTRRIARLGGRCAEKAKRLLEWLEHAARGLQAVEMRAAHGSFSPAQLILAKVRTVTFDWDGYDVADPARDVARFLYALRRLALDQLDSVRALDGAAEAFLETYQAVGPTELQTNLLFYQAAACLKLARTVAHWREKSEVMLDEGLSLLDLGVAR
jgi:aminoglycoside phosphotransferase (APT) family kinase protein